MDEVNLRGHEDKFVETAVFEVNFSKPAQCVDMEKSGFFSDFANSSLFGSFARFDVAFGDGPTVLGILD